MAVPLDAEFLKSALRKIESEERAAGQPGAGWAPDILIDLLLRVNDDCCTPPGDVHKTVDKMRRFYAKDVREKLAAVEGASRLQGGQVSKSGTDPKDRILYETLKRTRGR
jgi:hypothetical protein